MKRVFAISVLISMILFGMVKALEVQALQSASGSDWYLQDVDPAAQMGTTSEHSLRIDSSGHPHVVYEARGYIYYAWYDNVVWHFEPVDAVIDPDSAYPFLVLDHSDKPHITYRSGQSIKYAYWSGSLWNVQTVASGEVDPPQLALDASDQPHIVYSINNVPQTSGYFYAVKYATWASGAWQIQTIEQGINYNSNYTVFGTSIAMDSTGYPHLSYALNYMPTPSSACTKYCVKYAQWTGSAWSNQIVEQGDSSGTPISVGVSDLILDATAHPHLIFGRRLGGALFSVYLGYAYWAGSQWEIHTYGPGLGGGSLALDSDGNPKISAGRYYGTWNGNTWIFESISNDLPVSTSSLALDAQNHAHITYIAHTSVTSSTLKYAQQLPALTLNMDVTPKGHLSADDILTYTLAFSGPVGHNVLLVDPLPASVAYVSNSVTSPAVYSSTLGAIVWQGTVPTDTIPTVSFQGIVTYTLDFTSTIPVIINTAWLTDTEYGNSVKAIAIANGWYTYLPLALR